MAGGLPALCAAEVAVAVDPQSGLKEWTLHAEAIELVLGQRLPDQTRGFFLARGFPAAIADRIGSGCVMRTVLRNTSHAPGAVPVHVDLHTWRRRHHGNVAPIKLKEDWDAEWPAQAVPPAARLAFRWATFPTIQTFEPVGDYNWGMTSYALPPGERFDLLVTWRAGDTEHSTWIDGVECPRDR